MLPTSGCVRLERARCRKLSDWFCFFLCREKHGAMKRINWQVENRLRKHLRRRSQRPWRIPKGSTLMAQLHQFGLVRL